MAKSYIHLQYPHSCLSARFAVYHILASVLLPKISSSVLLFVAFSHLLVLFYLELRYAVIGKSNLFLSTSSFSSSLSYFSSNTSYLVFLSFPRSDRVLESCMVGPFSPLKSQGEMYNFHPQFSLSWDVSVRGKSPSITFTVIISLTDSLYAQGLNFATPCRTHPFPCTRHVLSFWWCFQVR